tara:strand:- start:176 stop:301 length:126 start_codon:yes stop_codon:yes gene_type:complete
MKMIKKIKLKIRRKHQRLLLKQKLKLLRPQRTTRKPKSLWY